MVNKNFGLIFNTNIYELCMLELDLIEAGENEDLKQRINDKKKLLVEMDKPRNWDVTVPNNMELEYEVGFTKFGLQLGKHYSKELNSITVKEYYCFIELLEKENKK